MSRLVYIDACGGASGDMLAGALLDLGWPLEDLRGHLATLGLDQVTVEAVAVSHGGVAGRRLAVHAPHEHAHRHLPVINQMLAALPSPVRDTALAVFARLAAAEGKVHGIAPEEVHFHEVGALDAIVDVVAWAAGLAWLGSPRVMASPLPLGRGWVDCAHGRLPLPAPAVVALLEGVPTAPWPEEVETVTPTGAACITATAAAYGPWPAMTVHASGIGGGSRESRGGANILRLVVGQPAQPGVEDSVAEITCHLDDMTGEDLAIALEAVLRAGALDVVTGPIMMKKGRPGQVVTVMAPPERAEELADLVLRQTTTLGVRIALKKRRTLPREELAIETPWGPVRAKRARLGGDSRLKPEADDLGRIARETGLGPAEIRRRIPDPPEDKE